MVIEAALSAIEYALPLNCTVVGIWRISRPSTCGRKVGFLFLLLTGADGTKVRISRKTWRNALRPPCPYAKNASYRRLPSCHDLWRAAFHIGTILPETQGAETHVGEDF